MFTQVRSQLRQIAVWLQHPLHFASLLSALVPLAFIVAYVLNYAMPFPMNDDPIHLQIPMALEVKTGDFTPSDLFTQFNSHRHFFTFATTIALTVVNGWDLRYEFALMLVLSVMTVVMLTGLFARHYPQLVAWMLPVFAAFMLSTQLGIHWLSTFYTSWHFYLFFALIGIWALEHMRPGWRPLLIALLMCWASQFSIANGAASWSVVGIYILLNPSYRKWQYALAMFGVFGVTLLMYIGAGISAEYDTMLNPSLLDLLRYLLSFYGSPLSLRNESVSQGAALLGIALTLVNVLYLWRTPELPKIRAWLALIVFMGSVGIITSISRYQFGLEFSLQERFSHPSSALWASVIALSVVSLARLAQQPPTRANRLFVQGLVLGLVSIGALWVGTVTLRYPTYWLTRQLSDQDNMRECFARIPLRDLSTCYDYDGAPITRYSASPHDALAAFNMGGYQNLPRYNLLADTYTTGDAVLVDTDDVWYGIHLRDWLLNGVPPANVWQHTPVPDEQSAYYMAALPHPPQFTDAVPNAARVWQLTRTFGESWQPLVFEGYAQGQNVDLAHDVQSTLWARVPDDGAFNVRYGELFTLTHWRISQSLTVPPCATVSLETFWTGDAPTTTDYSVTFTLADANGLGVSRADGATLMPMRYWQPQRAYYDMRALSVPCDLPAGAYNLLLGVYESESTQALAATTADGGALGGIVYLTTLTVTGG